jgi:hypothetical protein
MNSDPSHSQIQIVIDKIWLVTETSLNYLKPSFIKAQSRLKTETSLNYLKPSFIKAQSRLRTETSLNYLKPSFIKAQSRLKTETSLNYLKPNTCSPSQLFYFVFLFLFVQLNYWIDFIGLSSARCYFGNNFIN